MIAKIKYDWREPGKNATDITKGLDDHSYTAPIDLKGAVKLFGRDNRYITIGPDCMISVLQDPRGELEYGNLLKDLPWPHVDYSQGYLIMPWGEPVTVDACGTGGEVWTESDRAIVSLKAKDINKDMVMIQINFLFKTGVIEFHYKKAESGTKMLIGAVGAPGDYQEMVIEDESLDGKAFALDTNVTTIEEEQSTPFPKLKWTFPSAPQEPGPQEPSTPFPDEPAVETENEWRYTWDDTLYEYKITRRPK